MSTGVVVNRVRRGFYLDSVALMRLSRDLSARPGVEEAALMIGTAANKGILAEAGLLAAEGEGAAPGDLIVALRARDAAAGASALDEAEAMLARPRTRPGAGEWRPRTLASAAGALPGANLALISVPGAFAGAEARKALRLGLHVMIFSDNVPLEDEIELKREARARGLLAMGPDCGTAIIGGVPLAFANVVPRGDIGIVAASGTGLQEVASLIARGGRGLSHAIGVGGRDLRAEVGGIMTLMALDALDADAATAHIVLISKPPAAEVARVVIERIGRSRKPVTVCFLGAGSMRLPANATLAPTLKAAAESAVGGDVVGAGFSAATAAAKGKGAGGRWLRGLFSGGTLAGEAQLVLLAAGHAVLSNAPVPGAGAWGAGASGHSLLDLGDDAFTAGRPHPMIDPAVRAKPLRDALADSATAVVLLDVVIGQGAHADPAGEVARVLADVPGRRPPVVASVCGTEGDPQGYSRQVARLEAAGVTVAPCNALAAETAAAILGGPR